MALSPLTPRTRVSASVARCSAWAAAVRAGDDFALHDSNQLLQCLQSFSPEDMLSVPLYPGTKRSTTDHAVRSNSLRYHVDVKQFGDIFHSFEPEECMRTSVRATPHVCCQLYKSMSLQSTKSQSATPSRKPRDSSPYQAVSASTHVQSRSMSHVAQHRPNTCHAR